MATIQPCLAREEDDIRIAADGYDDAGEAAYLTLDGYDQTGRPPDVPTGLKFDTATGALSCNSQVDAESYTFEGNDKADDTPAGRLRTREVATVTTTGTPSTSADGTVAAGERRTYHVRAYDDLSELHSPPSRHVVVVDTDTRAL